MEKEFSTTITPHENPIGQTYCRSNPRRETIIAEIISSGHADERDQDAFREQIKTWSACLSIPTEDLLLCLIEVKRSRELPFDLAPLEMIELAEAWRENKN